ncbi:FAD dependent oxidoreductase [Waddlia chondrophila 2032/99]|uniref:FAD dependent oxidoreductase n=2 Tax=Waddlia chondrophila TaxID=71667 RepID=D6YWT3_WADCW|nr:FAD-dependent oxidoreductase [Waddlia chondrophila]ADI38594.1 FAD dependent oxidoreductase [Waddlia chondrophila WSU 86-1044]CCB91703.1 FAD dependent oxidoreductase [Waddlia chondrophila 2032/99]
MTKEKDHIAIVGAGFSGLACAFYLSEAGYPVTLYDPFPIGENASGISAGLLHYYTGPRATPPSDAEEKLKASLELFEASSDALGSSVFKKTGLFRPALNANQEKHYRKRAEVSEDIRWISENETLELLPQFSPLPGIWIANGYSVDTKRYLEGLWQACRNKGATWKKQGVKTLSEFEEDLVIAATGASPLLRDFGLSIHPVKGQILEIEWDIQLPFPISANVYLVPGTLPTRCFVGGTFEHHFDDSKPDPSTAQELLLPKMKALFPQFNGYKIVDCRAALRGSTPNRLPICGNIKGNMWALAGMGSKGLLHHAFYAKKLINEILCYNIP